MSIEIIKKGSQEKIAEWEKAHYTPGDSDKSVDLGGGISYKELMEGIK